MFSLRNCRRAATAVGVWLAVCIACTPQQPLPNPSNPSTSVVACTNSAECGSGKVCHLAIGAGICAPPCASDGDCNAIEPGFLCDAAAGNVCAPSCTTEINSVNVCTALGANLACGNDGHCQASAPATTALVRFFNATATLGATAVSVDGQPLTSAENGALPPDNFQAVASGGHTFAFSFPDGSAFTDPDPPGLIGGHHYTALILDFAGARQMQWFDDDAVVVPTNQAAVRFFTACKNLNELDLRLTTGSVTQTLVGDVAALDQPLPVFVASGTGSIGVAESGGFPTAMSAADVSLDPGQIYTVVTWCGGLLTVAETSILSADGVSSQHLYSGGLRLIDASDSTGIALYLDGSTAPLVGAANGQLGPDTGYVLLPVGAHSIDVTVDGAPLGSPLPVQVDTSNGDQAYTIVCGGSSIAGNVACLGPFLEPTTGASPLARLYNFAPYTYFGYADDATAPQAPPAATFLDGDGSGTALSPPLAFAVDSGDLPFAQGQLTLTFPEVDNASPGSMVAAVSLSSGAFNPAAGFRYYAIAEGSVPLGTLSPPLPATKLNFWLIGPSSAQIVGTTSQTTVPPP